MRNLTQTPQDKARMELNTVNLQLMWIIEHATRWHEIAKAADAMFHARLVWERCYKDLFEQQAEGGAPPPQSGTFCPHGWPIHMACSACIQELQGAAMDKS